jgi:hypothetical protein
MPRFGPIHKRETHSMLMRRFQLSLSFLFLLFSFSAQSAQQRTKQEAEILQDEARYSGTLHQEFIKLTKFSAFSNMKDTHRIYTAKSIHSLEHRLILATLANAMDEVENLLRPPKPLPRGTPKKFRSAPQDKSYLVCAILQIFAYLNTVSCQTWLHLTEQPLSNDHITPEPHLAETDSAYWELLTRWLQLYRRLENIYPAKTKKMATPAFMQESILFFPCHINLIQTLKIAGYQKWIHPYKDTFVGILSLCLSPEIFSHSVPPITFTQADRWDLCQIHLYRYFLEQIISPIRVLRKNSDHITEKRKKFIQQGYSITELLERDTLFPQLKTGIASLIEIAEKCLSVEELPKKMDDFSHYIEPDSLFHLLGFQLDAIQLLKDEAQESPFRARILEQKAYVEAHVTPLHIKWRQREEAADNAIDIWAEKVDAPLPPKKKKSKKKRNPLPLWMRAGKPKSMEFENVTGRIQWRREEIIKIQETMAEERSRRAKAWRPVEATDRSHSYKSLELEDLSICRDIYPIIEKEE